MPKPTSVDFLPIGLRIQGRKILIVGGGHVGFHKASLLARFASDVRVVSPSFLEEFQSLPFELKQKEYDPSDLDEVGLVYACTEKRTLNQQIRQDATKVGLLVSVCDAPALCEFISPAIYRQEQVTVAVSSDGKDVKRSIRILNRIRELIEKGLLSLD